jgi:hypothetical protein
MKSRETYMGRYFFEISMPIAGRKTAKIIPGKV